MQLTSIAGLGASNILHAVAIGHLRAGAVTGEVDGFEERVGAFLTLPSAADLAVTAAVRRRFANSELDTPSEIGVLVHPSGIGMEDERSSTTFFKFNKVYAKQSVSVTS